MPIGFFVCEEVRVPCAMIYAISTLPAYRGHGFASSVTNMLIEKGHESGHQAVVLCPTNDSLFEFYGNHTTMRDWFYCCETAYDRASLAGKSCVSKAAFCSIGEYGALRESLLEEFCHIEYDERTLSYQHMLCMQSGGGYVTVSSFDGIACAAIERDSENFRRFFVKEFLVDGISDVDALTSISILFNADELIVRTPVRAIEDHTNARRFGMISSLDLPAHMLGISNHAPFYGFAFD